MIDKTLRVRHRDFVAKWKRKEKSLGAAFQFHSRDCFV